MSISLVERESKPVIPFKLLNLSIRGWSLDSLQAHWIKNQPALAITEAHYDHSEMIGGNRGLEFSDLYFIEDGLGHNITAIAVGTGGEEGIDALQVPQFVKVDPGCSPLIFLSCRFSTTGQPGQVHMAD